MHSHRKGALALKILVAVSAGTLVPATFLMPNLAQVAVPLLRRLVKLAEKLESTPYTIKRSLTALKKNRLLKVSERNGEITFVLTEEGRRRVLKGQLDTLRISEPKRWDKKWRVVLFDIPESHKKARDALRRKLIELGFYQLQKSCFAHPFECRDQIDFITEFFQISHHVNYLVAESLEGQRELRQHFGV